MIRERERERARSSSGIAARSPTFPRSARRIDYSRSQDFICHATCLGLLRNSPFDDHPDRLERSLQGLVTYCAIVSRGLSLPLPPPPLADKVRSILAEMRHPDHSSVISVSRSIRFYGRSFSLSLCMCVLEHEAVSRTAVGKQRHARARERLPVIEENRGRLAPRSVHPEARADSPQIARGPRRELLPEIIRFACPGLSRRIRTCPFYTPPRKARSRAIHT